MKLDPNNESHLMAISVLAGIATKALQHGSGMLNPIVGKTSQSEEFIMGMAAAKVLCRAMDEMYPNHVKETQEIADAVRIFNGPVPNVRK